MFAARGWRVAILTNQAIVNRGLVSASDLEWLHAQMAETIARHGGAIAVVFGCPHRPDEGCAYRKPAPGLLQAAARHFAVPNLFAVARKIIAEDWAWGGDDVVEMRDRRC